MNIGDEYSVKFKIKAELIDAFAQLTGDQNSLHMTEKFGRKSMYRERVVHGMLPVLFIAAVPEFADSEKQAVIENISGSFLKPVFANETLELKVKVLKCGEHSGSFECEYVITNADTQSDVTIGQFKICYIKKKECVPPQKSSAALVLDSLKEKDLPFAEIQRGAEKNFIFEITHDNLVAYFEILKSGLPLDWPLSLADWAASFDSNNLLGNALLSTFVGMCIPGRHATFINFSTKFVSPLKVNQRYQLSGKVAFKSDSTLILKELIRVSEEGKEDEILSSSLTVKVNIPPVKMSSLAVLEKEAMDLHIKDKVVLVTGGSRGIGETTAKLLSLHGAKVAVNYSLSEEDANRVVKEIQDHQGQAMAVKADVSDRAQVKEMVARINQEFGPVDILVNNAVRDAKHINFLELTWDEIQKDVDVTVKGVFNCCQEVIPGMRKKKAGKIISLSTIYTENPPPGQAKYVLTKSALIGLTRSLAVEFAADNIQVNMVVPSLVETDLSKGVSKIFLESMKNSTPMKRLAEPADVAKTIVYLASSLSNFTTGQKVMVTGGNAPFL